MPRVSIVIPWHRNLDDLKRAIGSVFAQTVQDFEIIVVVNGADDAAWTSVRGLSADRRYRVERLEVGDASGARNHGLDAAAGELVFFLDADDIFFPDKLEIFLRVHAERPFDVAFSRGRRHRGDGVSWPFPIGHWDGGKPISEFFFCDGCTISASAIVMTTAVRDRVRFDGRFRANYEDPDLLMRAAHLGLDVLMLPDILYQWTDERSEHRLSRADNYAQRLAWIDQTGGAATEKAKAAFRARCVAQHAFPKLFWPSLRHIGRAVMLGAISPKEAAMFVARGLLPATAQRRLLDLYFRMRARGSSPAPSRTP